MVSKNVNHIIAATKIDTKGVSYQLFSEDHSFSDNWTSIANKHWWNKNVSLEYALSEIQVTEK